jgi:hypothetical protein
VISRDRSSIERGYRTSTAADRLMALRPAEH